MSGGTIARCGACGRLLIHGQDCTCKFRSPDLLDSSFPPDPSPLTLAVVFAAAFLVIGLAVAAGMWFGLATR